MQILIGNSLMKTLLVVARRVIIKIANMEYEKMGNKDHKTSRYNAKQSQQTHIFFFGRKPVKITTNRTPKKSRLLENILFGKLHVAVQLPPIFFRRFPFITFGLSDVSVKVNIFLFKRVILFSVDAGT